MRDMLEYGWLFLSSAGVVWLLILIAERGEMI